MSESNPATIVSPTEAKMSMALDDIITKDKTGTNNNDKRKNRNFARNNKKRQDKLNEKRGVVVPMETSNNEANNNKQKVQEKKKERPTKPEPPKHKAAMKNVQGANNIVISFVNEKAKVVKSEPITSLSKRIGSASSLSSASTSNSNSGYKESRSKFVGKPKNIIQTINNTLAEANSSKPQSSRTSLSDRFSHQRSHHPANVKSTQRQGDIVIRKL